MNVKLNDQEGNISALDEWACVVGGLSDKGDKVNALSEGACAVVDCDVKDCALGASTAFWY